MVVYGPIFHRVSITTPPLDYKKKHTWLKMASLTPDFHEVYFIYDLIILKDKKELVVLNKTIFIEN